MLDILTVGELLIDLTQTGLSDTGVPQYAANPGGAPANVAVAAARLGAAAGFMGKVGEDAFGRYLRSVLKNCGVDDSRLLTTGQAPTTLAVVSVDAAGDRSFSFYRKGSADTLLEAGETERLLTETPKILHFGSVSLVADPARSATMQAVRLAKSRGACITYDPNYRANLWPDEAAAVEQMKQPLPLVDIIKLSEEEVPLLTGCSDWTEGSRLLCEMGIGVVLVTLGDAGAFIRMGSQCDTLPGFPTRVADTNGAGDSFFGAFLSRLAARRQGPLQDLTFGEVTSAVQFANMAASLTCSRSGAIPAMPTLQQVEALLPEGKHSLG